MPRRASSGVNIGQMVGIAVAIIGFFVIAALLVKLIAGDFFGGNSGPKTGNATSLNLANYRDNAKSLRGNIYQVEGKIEEMLRWSQTGRLISFEANDGFITIPVPVLVPAEFSNVNLERGAEMNMVVRVNSEGTLVAETVNQ